VVFVVEVFYGWQKNPFMGESVEEEEEEEESVEILKPRNDKREYQRVVLPNDLQVLIISDPDTDKVACSFCCVPVFFCFPPPCRFLSLSCLVEALNASAAGQSRRD
jgi:hypothetical protein